MLRIKLKQFTEVIIKQTEFPGVKPQKKNCNLEYRPVMTPELYAEYLRIRNQALTEVGQVKTQYCELPPKG